MNNFLRWLLRKLEQFGFFVGKEGVFLNELRESPIFLIKGGNLVITTAHSLKHSAKEVFRFEAVCEEKKCLVRAYQKLVTQSFGGKYQQHIPIAEWLNHISPDEAVFYWVDPDQTRHRIETKTLTDHEETTEAS